MVEMRPNLILDAQETITGTRIADVFAPTWSIIDGFAVWRLTRFRKGVLRLVRGHSVSIGKRTSDNGVDVHRKRVPTCTVASSYVVASLMVTASRSQLACRTGHAGGGRERPPLGLPGSAVRGGHICAAHATPAEGRSRPKYPYGKATQPIKCLIKHHLIAEIAGRCGSWPFADTADQRPSSLCEPRRTRSRCPASDLR